MRILGRLPHPDMQITVFANDGRYPVQFEYRGLTQQYRFRQGPGLTGFSDVAQLIDERFTSDVMATFRAMRATHNRVTNALKETDPDDEFPSIV